MGVGCRVSGIRDQGSAAIVRHPTPDTQLATYRKEKFMYNQMGGAAMTLANTGGKWLISGIQGG